MIREDTEIVILGSGFAGSLLAILLRQIGRRVVLIERGQHPRFALGESSTPLANLALEELARDYSLPWLADLAEYGKWKKVYPDLVCGLKRGFTFIRHHADQPFEPDPEHGNELLVAASPRDEVADTHWLRADIDHFLVRKAQEAGVVYLDQSETSIRQEGAGGWRLEGRRDGEPLEVRGKFLVDATGPAEALPRALGIDSAPVGMRTNSWTIFSHFEGVRRWEEVFGELGGSTAEHPYRCDDAAMHHVLDEGWMWVLPFDNGVTSAGVQIPWSSRPPYSLRSSEQTWQQLLERYPGLARQFEHARPIRPFVRTGRIQRLARSVAGPNWALLASTVYTLDALYSTGNAHGLHTLRRLARLIERHWDGDLEGALVGYQEALFREVRLLDLLVEGSYRAFGTFGLFQAFAMYYFAGAIACEEARRQGRATADDDFLMAHDPEYVGAVEHGHAAVTGASRQQGPDVEAFARLVAAAIAPWNTTGLCDARKRQMYPY